MFDTVRNMHALFIVAYILIVANCFVLILIGDPLLIVGRVEHPRLLGFIYGARGSMVLVDFVLECMITLRVLKLLVSIAFDYFIIYFNVIYIRNKNI